MKIELTSEQVNQAIADKVEKDLRELFPGLVVSDLTCAITYTCSYDLELLGAFVEVTKK